MQNRYDNILRKNNQLIIDLAPANHILRLITALELKKIAGAKAKVLEIGIGEGDLTKYLIENNPDISLDALDVSAEMINEAKKRLSGNKINFICADAFEYLQNYESKYEVIVSAWTLHNFRWEDKQKIFEAIFQKLNSGGHLILMDKVYPDDEKLGKELLEVQQNRYRQYLEKDVAREIIEHEEKDFTSEYRMQEKRLVDCLTTIGYSSIAIADRVERDVVLIAKKK